jgi:hypothetical protein
MAASSVVVKRGREQFQGLFSEMWAVTCSINIPDCNDGDATGDSIAVPGVALGDIVVSFSLGVDQEGLVGQAYVSAANEVKIIVVNGTGASVNLAATTAKLVVARSAF